jgi:hypothetical protein
MAQTVAAARDQRMEAPARNVFAFAWRQSRRHQPWLCLLAVIIFPLTMRRSAAAADHRPSGRRSESRFAGLAGRHLPGGGAPAGRAEVPPARLRGYGERAHHPRFAPRRPRSGSRRRGGDGSIVASEAERVGLVGEAFSEPILQGGILVAVLGYMLVVEPTIALVSLGFFVPQILLLPMIQQFINRRARRKVKLVRQLGDQIVDQAADRRCAGTTRQVYAVRMSYYRWNLPLTCSTTS